MSASRKDLRIQVNCFLRLPAGSLRSGGGTEEVGEWRRRRGRLFRRRRLCRQKRAAASSSFRLCSPVGSEVCFSLNAAALPYLRRRPPGILHLYRKCGSMGETEFCTDFFILSSPARRHHENSPWFLNNPNIRCSFSHGCGGRNGAVRTAGFHRFLIG